MPQSESNPKLKNRWLVLAITVSLVLLADQLTKWWAVNTLAPSADGLGRVIDVVGSLRFLYAENTGMAFSKGAGSGRWIGLLVIGIVIVMVVFAGRATSRIQVILLGVVIGGAVGNLLDRLFRPGEGWLGGAVVDFIDLQWWPVFNIADASVVVGGILLVLVASREPSGGPEEAGGPEADTTPDADIARDEGAGTSGATGDGGGAVPEPRVDPEG